MHATTSRALRDFCALVLGDDPLHLHQQPVLRSFSDRPLDEVYVDSAFGELLDDNLLMDVATGQAIGAMHQHDVDFTVSGRVTKCIESGAIQTRATKAVVDVATLGWYRQGEPLGCVLERLE